MYADQRWIGNHGIGRFAKHVLEGLRYCPVPLTSHPAAPFDSVQLTWALRRLGPNDLFFNPGYNTPLYCRAPFVFTIHDLNHILCPESSQPHIHLYYATVVKRACHRAASILTVSEFTRQQIIAWSGTSPEKVFNVGCGVDAAYCPDGDCYEVGFPYLLSVSNRKPHKNEPRLLQAFARARLDPRIHLVLTGKATVDLLRLVEEFNLSDRVNFVGLVPEDRLPSLYRGALALVFPSLYEGFGLPVVEAMACGIPVVTSDSSALAEVAGDAALLVSPRCIEGIAGAIENIVCDHSLRRRLIDAGLSRAARFSWSTTVSNVQKVLTNHRLINNLY